ncbi:hypothetical protein [Actinoplanes utahensis]|uniref:Uncharacterized protein n=1 Tax=Actinoplanes utahensis TaxID=1869 RepID=A0A0A6UUG9_ACTUT|nr:hypothetical protein [Actinoplanes utahensis]KHD78119.1 hypothetical protein MB27_06490 [Actinoplanes utahensis]GIF30595.1 hypothetical protein Aut01nite_35810 [Actinoplanes utahensis]
MHPTDFDLPVTEEFLTRVRRGVRRRRTLRTVAVGGTVLGLSAVALAGWPSPSHPPLPAASAGATAADVDRFRITYVPHEVRIDPKLSNSIVADTPSGAADRAPSPGETGATASVRRLAQADGGSYLWITVLRPLPLDRGVLPQHLLGTQALGAEVVDTFTVPAGTAKLIRTMQTIPGGRTAAYDVLITVPDGTVISIGGNARVPESELRAVAVGLLPA